MGPPSSAFEKTRGQSGAGAARRGQVRRPQLRGAGGGGNGGLGEAAVGRPAPARGWSAGSNLQIDHLKFVPRKLTQPDVILFSQS